MNDEFGGSSGQITPPMTADAARLQYQQMMHGDGLSSLNIDQDGAILGFKVPKHLIPALEIAIPNAINWLQRVGSSFSYDKALQLSRWLELKDAKAKSIATAAEYGFRWGLIGIRPIADAMRNAKTYAQQRKALFDEFAPIIEAGNNGYKNNEVIQHAFDSLHGEMSSYTKRLASDLLTLTPIIYLGIKEQRKLAESRSVADNPLYSSSPHIDARVDAFVDQMNRETEYKVSIQDKLTQLKKDFIRKQKGRLKGSDKKTLDEAALGEFFDNQIRDDVVEHLKKGRDHFATGNKKDITDDPNNYTGSAVVAGFSLVSQIIKSNIDENIARHKKTADAWSMIKNLKTSVESQCKNGVVDQECMKNRIPENIYIDDIDDKGGSFTLKEYIIKIFQQNEKDHGRPVIGQALLSQLQPAVDSIAKAIADGGLDSLALVNLVGDGKVVIHKGQSLRKFASTAEVEKLIEEQLAILNSPEHITSEEFFANFADPAFVQGVFKKNTQTLKGIERDAYFTLFPDEMLLQAGVKKAEIIASRKEAHKYLYDIAAAGILHLAEQDPQRLEALGVQNQKQVIDGLAEKINNGEAEALKTAVDADPAVRNILRTATLNAQVKNIDGGASFWTNRIKEVGAVHKKLYAANNEGVIESASKRIGNKADEVPLVSAQEREKERRDKGSDSPLLNV